MAIKWIKTPHKGLRYYQHATRKHGKKKDRYYSIRIKVDGRDYTYGVGWWSEGIPEEVKANDPDMGFEEYCLSQMKLYKANIRDGSGPKSPKEKREIAAEKDAQEREEQDRHEKEAVTVADFFNDTYFPWVKENKTGNTCYTENNLYKNWIKPTIGNMPLIEVSPFHIEKIKKALSDQERSARTIEATLAVIRQIFNHAKRQEIYSGDNPTNKVKMPKVDNAKLRYLMPDEIDRLLSALKEVSDVVHDQAALSVNCGLRFSEVARLRWEDVNYDTGTIAIRDAKTGSRTVFLNEYVKSMLEARQGDQKTGLVFPNHKQEKKNEKQGQVSKTFQRVVDELFNKDIKDRRLRISFHSLRHTFGTHVYENSGDLYLTQKALGHKTMVMAARYAKMSETKLREAFTKMSDVLKKGKEANSNEQAGKVVNFQK